MSDNFLSSSGAAKDTQSYYNVVRTTGFAKKPFWESLDNGDGFVGDPSLGHKFKYIDGSYTPSDNSHLEGGKRADVESYPPSVFENHLQIFKKTYGITRSKAKSMDVDGISNHLAKQRELSLRRLELDIEKALIGKTGASGAPVQRVGQAGDAGAVAGKLAGALHYCANIIDCGGTALNYTTHLEPIFRQMFEAGLSGERVVTMTSTFQKSALNGLLDTQKRYNGSDTNFVRNVSTIEDAGWFQNVELPANPYLDADCTMIYVPEYINPVLLDQVKDRQCDSREFDSEAYENIFELTLQVTHPAAVYLLKNLKAS